MGVSARFREKEIEPVEEKESFIKMVDLPKNMVLKRNADPVI